MDIEKNVGCLIGNPNDLRPERNVRHKVAVHHIHVEQRPTTLDRLLGMRRQAAEIRREDGGSDLYLLTSQ